MRGELVVSCTSAAKAAPYLEALKLCGIEGERVRVVAAEEGMPSDPRRLAAQAAGLVLTGGPDLAPERFGEEPHPNANLTILPGRDEIEWQLMEGACEAGTPTFGVCRGIQILNAFLGGTLFQDLRLQWPGSLLHDLSYPRDALIHQVQVTDAETTLGEILSRETPLVNSRHHQAIKVIAPGLRPVAIAPDGIVEAAVGRDDRWWLWAVQWHPENLVSLAIQRALWERFVAAVEAREESAREVVAP